MADDEESERLEREALGRIVNAMRHYQQDAEWEVSRWEFNYNRLPAAHKELLSSQPAKFAAARRCIHTNTFFIKAMLAAFDPVDGEPAAVPSMLAGANAAGDAISGQQRSTSAADVDKVRYVLKNLVRDWSLEGAAERQQSYGRVCAELRQLFTTWPKDSATAPPRVLVPGAGLGRLCCDIASCGFQAQGNEFSYFMLITSSFILNNTWEPDQYTLFPWVTSSCNQPSDAAQLAAVTLPDTCPAGLVAQGGRPGLLSMAAGDFVEVYSAADQAGSWDCVATCFFIDTAHNVVEYLEVIHRCLKPGGYWVNIGPLLYHWAEGVALEEMSIELSLAEIKRVALSLGFELVREEQDIDMAYIGKSAWRLPGANPRSMYKTVYQGSMWTMRKKAT
ncbi:N2227-like protein-domain-containing protein [Haematococcus lacustris]